MEDKIDMRNLLIAAATLALSAAVSFEASAGVTTGTKGLGFVTDDAPSGGRYVVSPKMAVDLGIGFAKQSDDYDTTGVYGASTFNLNLDLSILIHDSCNTML